MSAFSFERVLTLIDESILLSSSVKLALHDRVLSVRDDTEKLEEIGSYLASERRFILDYLKDVVRHDETNATAEAVHRAMEQAYLQNMRSRERTERETENSENFLHNLCAIL